MALLGNYSFNGEPPDDDHAVASRVLSDDEMRIQTDFALIILELPPLEREDGRERNRRGDNT
jgi:hypothetical protein